MDYFLNKYNKILGKSIQGYTSEVKRIFINYEWMGNVRELENVIEYMVNISSKDFLILENIPVNIKEKIVSSEQKSIQVSKIDDVVKKLIDEAIELYGDTVEGKTLAAKALGISRATLYRKLQ